MSRVRAKSENRDHRNAFADDGYYFLGGTVSVTPTSTDRSGQSERLHADHILMEHADKDGVVFILRLGGFFQILGSGKPRVVRSVHQICGAVFRDRPGAKGRVIDYSFHSGDFLHFRFTGIGAFERRECAEMIVDIIGERILGDRFVSFARTRDLAKRGAQIPEHEAPLTTPADIDAAYFSAHRDANPAVGNDWVPVRKFNIENMEPGDLQDAFATEKAVDRSTSANDWLIHPEHNRTADRGTRRVAVTPDEDWLLIRDIQTRHPNTADADALLAEVGALARQTVKNDWAVSHRGRSSKTAETTLPSDGQQAKPVDRKSRRQANEMARNSTTESASPAAAAITGKTRKG
jgi:hypothetical protein